MKKRLWTAGICALGLLLLVLDAKTALQGASEGLQLCLHTIVPSLFPFFVLSVLLTNVLPGIKLLLLRPVGKICGIPRGCESLLLIGILGGYPTGAQAAAQMCGNGVVSKDDASRMLGICNLAGPSFLFGIVSVQFTDPRAAWLLWSIHIASALLTGMVLPGKSQQPVSVRSCEPISLPEALERSVKITALVCGWIVLFRVILAFLNRWFMWLLPVSVQVLVTGVLELANGCCELSRIPQEGLRFLICAGILSFGGLCVTMQTASVASQLSLRWYFPGKLLQTTFSLLLACILQNFLFTAAEQIHIHFILPIILCAIAAITVKFLHKSKNNSSIPVAVGV